LTRFVTAFLYVEAQSKAASADAELTAMTAQRAAALAFTASAAQETTAIKSEIAALEAQRVVERGGAMKDAEAEVAKASKKLVQVCTFVAGVAVVVAVAAAETKKPTT
jgi:hypothetical protein